MIKDTNTIKQRYFDWLCSLVNNHSGKSYNYLLDYLYRRPFTYILDMDENRAIDGCDLRYRFYYELYRDDLDYSYVMDSIGHNKPCSVLEMIIALAVKCEENITWDFDKGDQTYIWFWEMLHNLKLDGMTDNHFSTNYVEDVIDILLDRTYTSEGDGGLFIVKNSEYDLRRIDIWFQLNLYLEARSNQNKNNFGGGL